MHWNIQIARIFKDFIFDAGFIIILLLIYSLAPNKKKYLGVLTFSVLLLFVFCIRSGTETISIPLLSYAYQARSTTLASKCLSSTSNIVVLGGGMYSSELLTEDSTNRVLASVELIKNNTYTNKTPIVFFSGGHSVSLKTSEATVMARYFKMFTNNRYTNIKFFTENQSLTTFENAIFTKELLTYLKLPPNIILITSDIHLARAVSTFKRFGFKVCAWPVYSPNISSTGILNFHNAANFGRVLNEYFGLIGYKMRGLFF